MSFRRKKWSSEANRKKKWSSDRECEERLERFSEDGPSVMLEFSVTVEVLVRLER